MERIEAAYARQSVEKKDSLFIKAQLEICKKASANEGIKTYQDRGYSGKNIDRPGFQRLLRDVRAGKVSKLYVYRLDRFSRSIADFGQLWTILKENDVEFVSVTENFDTSSPMGRAMLHIIMVFAQLERETTAERVKELRGENLYPGDVIVAARELTREGCREEQWTMLGGGKALRKTPEGTEVVDLPYLDIMLVTDYFVVLRPYLI